MNEVLETVKVKDELFIYLQRNSKVWLTRFKIGGKWMARTTKQREKSEAMLAALEIRMECVILHKNGVAIQTKSFRDVAKLAIERMDSVPSNVKGYVSFTDYKRVLNKYHIPFFDRTYITSIDYEKLAAFDVWRVQQLGRTPAASTLKTHNAALQRVFDEAVMRKWMTQSKVPGLSSASGVNAERRAHFTTEEIAKIEKAFPGWINDSRKEVTRQIRQMLYYYFHIALHTGLRPGTEMDNLCWNDFELHSKDKIPHVVITVRKGKTTLHTGTRRAVGHSDLMEIVLDMHARSQDDDVPDDYNPLVFRLPDGRTTKELGRNFTALLKTLKLESSPGGKRTLYSLRHTYITQRLLAGLKHEWIAKQCGTSAAMIHLHYDHMTAEMHTKELVGTDNAELTKLIKTYNDLD